MAAPTHGSAERRCRTAARTGGPAVCDDGAVAQADDTPGSGGEFGVVRDEDDRGSDGVQVRQQVDNPGAGARVQVSRRLVGEDDRRLADQGARDRDPLTLTAGQLRGLLGSDELLRALWHQ
jgi:hypothetical protein